MTALAHAADESLRVTQEEYRLLLQNDFHSFLHRSFCELNPRTPFLRNWHIEVLAAKLESVRLGRTKRLIVNLPPRHLKSHAASVAFPAWWLGHDPAVELLCASYGQELSDKLSRDCRTLMTSAFYESHFPTRLSPARAAVEEFATTGQGFRLATSIGGVVTGRGGDAIIIDDPLKPEEAMSDTLRTRVNDWYNNTLYSRLNNRRKGAIVIIMQRLHEDDLVGHVLQQEAWDVVSFPAIAEADESHRVDTWLGPRVFTRKAGEPLHEAREPLDELERLRRALGGYNFAGQYQQTPSPSGGGMVKRDWFQYYDAAPERFERFVQSWDTANKATELADYSVCTTWGVKKKHYYLVKVLRQKLNYPELKRAVRAEADLFKPDVVLIEDRASGTQLIQELRDEGLSQVKGMSPEGDKVMRLHAQTAVIENGFVHLPRDAPWLENYLAEMMAFPRGRHDDQVDSTAQALAWFANPGSGYAWLEYARQKLEEMGQDTGNKQPVPKPPRQLVETKMRDPVTGEERISLLWV